MKAQTANHKKCLVLNADYSLLGVIDWKRALIWSIQKSNIEIIDFYKDDYAIGVNKQYAIPAVVRSFQYVKLYSHRVNFSRKNLFLRDNYTCQYCGNKPDIKDLTYDHIIPKSLWDNKYVSPTNWTNIVTACVDCNRKKGNKTPQQANMKLKEMPYIPNKSLKYLPINALLFRIRSDIPKEWTTYITDHYSK